MLQTLESQPYTPCRMGEDASVVRTSLLGERACIWGGLVMVVCLVIGIWPLAGFLPPPSPVSTAGEIARAYAANSNGIIAGSLLVMVGAAFFMLFCVALSAAMERHSPSAALLSRAQTACAAVNVVLFTLVALFWTVAAYRSDAEPSEVRLFNDMAWIIMVVPAVPFMIQLIAVGVVVLSVQSAQRLPRWVGYFNIWCALAVIPGMLSGFFKTGPIAWNGILSFWLEAAVFVTWLSTMSPILLRAIPATSGSRGRAIASESPLASGRGAG